MRELRARFAQDQTNHANEREAMKRELREAQKREITALRSEFKAAQEALRQQFAESNGAQQRENAAQTEEIAGFRSQQEKFLQELANFKQQFVQLNNAQSSCDKKIKDLNGQVTAKIGNLAQDLGNLKEKLMQLKNAQSSSDKKITDFVSQLAQAQQNVENLRKQFLDDRLKFPFDADPLGGLISQRPRRGCCQDHRDEHLLKLHPSKCRRSRDQFGVLLGEQTGPVDLLRHQGAQDRANSLHDPDVLRRPECLSPEELGGRGLRRRRLVDGNRPT
jgi:DNA repair exonuclease SbcCD ATPase subunit